MIAATNGNFFKQSCSVKYSYLLNSKSIPITRLIYEALLDSGNEIATFS